MCYWIENMAEQALKKKIKLRNTAVKSVDKIVKESQTIILTFEADKLFNERIIALRDTMLEKVNRVKELDADIIDLIEDEEQLIEEDEKATEFSIFSKERLRAINIFIERHYTNKEETLTVTSSLSNRAVRLPKLDIKHFSGQPEHWSEFWDSFNCAIHENDTISDVQKMTYLKNLVEGSAAQTISGFKISKDNYLIALNLLKERYNNKHLQVTTHMNNLLELEPVTDLKHVKELRDIYNTVETQIRSLENLGIDSKMYGPFLIPVLQRKIPSELNLIISRQFTTDECWDIALVLKAFKAELIAREKSVFANNSAESQITAASLHTYSSPREKSQEFICVFCEKGHKPQHCKIVTKLDARKAILKEKRRCFKCLKSGHVARNCTSNIKCHNCSGRHHLAVCNTVRLLQS